MEFSIKTIFFKKLIHSLREVNDHILMSCSKDGIAVSLQTEECTYFANLLKEGFETYNCKKVCDLYFSTEEIVDVVKHIPGNTTLRFKTKGRKAVFTFEDPQEYSDIVFQVKLRKLKVQKSDPPELLNDNYNLSMPADAFQKMVKTFEHINEECLIKVERDDIAFETSNKNVCFTKTFHLTIDLVEKFNNMDVNGADTDKRDKPILHFFQKDKTHTIPMYYLSTIAKNAFLSPRIFLSNPRENDTIIFTYSLSVNWTVSYLFT